MKEGKIERGLEMEFVKQCYLPKGNDEMGEVLNRVGRLFQLELFFTKGGDYSTEAKKFFGFRSAEGL